MAATVLSEARAPEALRVVSGGEARERALVRYAGAVSHDLARRAAPAVTAWWRDDAHRCAFVDALPALSLLCPAPRDAARAVAIVAQRVSDHVVRRSHERFEAARGRRMGPRPIGVLDVTTGERDLQVLGVDYAGVVQSEVNGRTRVFIPLRLRLSVPFRLLDAQTRQSVDVTQARLGLPLLGSGPRRALVDFDCVLADAPRMRLSYHREGPHGTVRERAVADPQWIELSESALPRALARAAARGESTAAQSARLRGLVERAGFDRRTGLDTLLGDAASLRPRLAHEAIGLVRAEALGRICAEAVNLHPLASPRIAWCALGRTFSRVLHDACAERRLAGSSVRGVTVLRVGALAGPLLRRVYSSWTRDPARLQAALVEQGADAPAVRRASERAQEA